jgi:hypothetical protein
MVFFYCNRVYKNSEPAYELPSFAALAETETKKFKKPSISRRHP